MTNGNWLRNLGRVLSEQWSALKSACIILHNVGPTDTLFTGGSGLNEHGDQIALSPQKRVVSSNPASTSLAKQCDKSRNEPCNSLHL